MNSRVTTFFFIPVCALGFICAIAWFYRGFFHETHICTHCGAMQETRRVLWIPFTEIKQTPLSLYQHSVTGSSSTPHQWLFASGGGGTVRCAIGEGRHLYRAIESTEAVRALKAIRQLYGDATAELWTHRLLDPETSRMTHTFLLEISESPQHIDTLLPMITESYDLFYETVSPALPSPSY